MSKIYPSTLILSKSSQTFTFTNKKIPMHIFHSVLQSRILRSSWIPSPYSIFFYKLKIAPRSKPLSLTRSDLVIIFAVNYCGWNSEVQQDLQASHLACLDIPLTSKLVSLHSNNQIGVLPHSPTTKRKDIFRLTCYKSIFKCKGLTFDALGEKQHDQEQKLF